MSVELLEAHSSVNWVRSTFINCRSSSSRLKEAIILWICRPNAKAKKSLKQAEHVKLNSWQISNHSIHIQKQKSIPFGVFSPKNFACEQVSRFLYSGPAVSSSFPSVEMNQTHIHKYLNYKNSKQPYSLLSYAGFCSRSGRRKRLFLRQL